MAPPGETECRRPMPCGSGTWGDIPVEDDTVYVDGSYTGGSSDGSAAHPYTSIDAALSNAPEGAIVAMAAGTYNGLISIGKSVRLGGVCPELVTLHQQQLFALVVDQGQVEIHGVTVRGGAIAAGGGAEVLIEGVHVIETQDAGVVVGAASGTAAPATVTLRSSLIEKATSAGVVSYSSVLEVDGCEIRGTLADTSGYGFGIGAQPGLIPDRSSAWVHDTRVQGSFEAGLHGTDADMVVESVAVMDTRSNPLDGEHGYGMAIQGIGRHDLPISADVAHRDGDPSSPGRPVLLPE